MESILDYLNLEQVNKVVESPRILNHGLNHYENLYLMKPTVIKDYITVDEELQEFGTDVKNDLGLLNAFYPTSVTRFPDSEIEVNLVQINFIPSDKISSFQLSSLKINDKLFEKYAFIFKSSAILQGVFEKICLPFLKTGTVGKLPESITNMFPELDGVPIRVNLETIDLNERILDSRTKFDLHYADYYKINGEFISTFNIEPTVLEELYKPYMLRANYKDTRGEEFLTKNNAHKPNVYSTEIESNFIYSGETYDMADVTAIKINKTMGLLWDNKVMAMDLANKLSVENPSISATGTNYGIINSAYNPLINMMRDNSFYMSRLKPSAYIGMLMGGLYQSEDKSGFVRPHTGTLIPKGKPAWQEYSDTLVTMSRLDGLKYNLSPYVERFMTYSEQFKIIQEYLLTKLPIPTHNSNIIDMTITRGGISNSDLQGPRSSENTKSFGDYLTHQVFQTGVKIKKYLFIPQPYTDESYIADSPTEIKKLINKYHNRKILGVTLYKNNIFADIEYHTKEHLMDKKSYSIEETTNVTLDGMAQFKRLDADIISIGGKAFIVGGKLDPYLIMLLKTDVRDISQLIKMKMNLDLSQGYFNIFQLPQDKVEITIDKYLMKDEIEDSIIPTDFKGELFGLSTVRDYYRLEEIEREMRSFYDRNNAKGQMSLKDSLITEFGATSRNYKESRSTERENKKMPLLDVVKGFRVNQRNYVKGNLIRPVNYILENNLMWNIKVLLGYETDYYLERKTNLVSDQSDLDPLNHIRKITSINQTKPTTDRYARDLYRNITQRLAIKYTPIMKTRDKETTNLLYPLGDYYYAIDIQGLNEENLAELIVSKAKPISPYIPLIDKHNITRLEYRKEDWLNVQ